MKRNRGFNRYRILLRTLLGILPAFMFPGMCAVCAGTVSVANTEVETEREIRENPVYDPTDSCAVYIYMCGSNLESKYGLASQNIEELLEADIPDRTSIILETGGSSRWWSSRGIADDRLQRYVIQDQELELVEELENGCMGDPDTFSSFLKWGVENYPADRSILVIWDHGGTAADGVCYDENFRYNCLNRKELTDAFEAASLPKKFDLILFDTCYMGSLETASLVQDYAHYMTASQKIVPARGLDYKVLAESFEGNDDETLGRIICDSFMDKCREEGREKEAQLTFYDLSGAKAVASSLNLLSVDMRLENSIIGNTYRIFRTALDAHVDNGARDVNVIDLGSFMDEITPEGMPLLELVIRENKESLVRYQVKGESTDCTGVSVYYPFRYSEEQLAAYAQNCPAENYSKLLEEIYSDLPEEMITFEDRGSIAEDGSFEITLSEDSAPYLRGIICKIQMENDTIPVSYSRVLDGEVDTYDSSFSRRDALLTVNSTFRGDGVALDGHLLMLTVVPRRVTSTYTAPVCVNGEDTWYTFVRSKKDGVHTLVSTAIGNVLDEQGLPTRDARQLKPGDRVCTYRSYDEEGVYLSKQEEFVIGEDGGTLSYVPLPAGRYRYQFVVTDIIGNTYGSDYAFFEIEEEEGERNVRITEVINPDF